MNKHQKEKQDALQALEQECKQWRNEELVKAIGFYKQAPNKNGLAWQMVAVLEHEQQARKDGKGPRF